MFEYLMNKINYAKTACNAHDQLCYTYGMILMAAKLKAITKDEYMKLNHECITDGINNKKYFD